MVSTTRTVAATPRLTTASCPNRARTPPSWRGHSEKATDRAVQEKNTSSRNRRMT
jgi:hypothetical protein